MNKIKLKKNNNNKIKIKKGLKEDYSGARRAAQYIPQIQDPRDRMLHEIKWEGRGMEKTFFFFNSGAQLILAYCQSRHLSSLHGI